MVRGKKREDTNLFNPVWFSFFWSATSARGLGKERSKRSGPSSHCLCIPSACLRVQICASKIGLSVCLLRVILEINEVPMIAL